MEIKLQQHAEKLTKKDIPFLIGLSLLGFFLFLFYTWAMPLIDPDEPRYASTARDMILNGNWVVPHFNGVPRINKPPLFYWAIAISYKIFGINEFSARLPSALAATGTVLITYLWGKRLEDRENGFWAGIVLMASPLFFLISRFCITDMLLTFFACSSLYLFFVEYTEANKSNLRRLFLYFLLSMVFLVKGPVGILLFILITLCFLLWIRDLRYLRRLWYLPGFLLFLGIVCAWGIPFWLSLGTKQISSLLSQEMSGRFVSGYAHPEPFYYYLPVFIIGFFPWSLFVFITFIHAIKQRKTMPIEEKRQVYFFCSWLILTLVFFSMSHSKLMTYVLPLSPSVALLTTSISRWETEGKLGKRHLWVLWPALFVSIMIPIVLVVTMPKWVSFKYGLSTIHIAIPIIILLIGTLIALIIFILSKRFFQLKKVFCFTNCIFLVITITYSAKYLGTFRSTKDIVEKCLPDKGENYVLMSYTKVIPSLVFYSGKNILQIEDDTQLKKIVPDKGTSIYVVMSLNDYQKKQAWIQKRKLHAVCQNNAHVLLKRESN
ncbi:MAG TPA: ArnT family glycosyltransferase [Candidatus Wunengus sp. YC60]|uniref:ArnT family glycosyltransferase n=1 Tax=Candidatus Wunengus sp. YC60 TaxID=3367697 RepID=UPI00402872A9